MKTRIMISVFAAMWLIFAGSVSFAGGPIWARQKKQHARIDHGLKSGDITGREYGRLIREQARIQKEKKEVWRDGHLDFRERRELVALQNRASKHIYRSKVTPRCNQCRSFARPSCDRHRQIYCKSYRGAKVLHRHHRQTYSLGNYISGLIAEPGWVVAWSVGLD